MREDIWIASTLIQNISKMYILVRIIVLPFYFVPYVWFLI